MLPLTLVKHSGRCGAGRTRLIAQRHISVRERKVRFASHTARRTIGLTRGSSPITWRCCQRLYASSVPRSTYSPQIHQVCVAVSGCCLPGSRPDISTRPTKRSRLGISSTASGCSKYADEIAHFNRLYHILQVQGLTSDRDPVTF